MEASKPNVPYNMTEELLAQMNWMNEPESFDHNQGVLSIVAGQGSDFFNNPEDSVVVGSAPFFYRTVDGDFVAKALVKPDFSSQWNALALMLYIDSSNWVKFAFENSDATGPSIVTVVTKGTSDDANGAIIHDTDKLWLAMVRKDHICAMHWSIDGITYRMARLTSIPATSEIKIGIEAQSPVGAKAKHKVLYFSIEPITVDNLRDINP